MKEKSEIRNPKSEIEKPANPNSELRTRNPDAVEAILDPARQIPELPEDAREIAKPYNHPLTGQTVFFEHGGHCWGATRFYIGPQTALNGDLTKEKT